MFYVIIKYGVSSIIVSCYQVVEVFAINCSVWETSGATLANDSKMFATYYCWYSLSLNKIYFIYVCMCVFQEDFTVVGFQKTFTNAFCVSYSNFAL